MHNAFIGVVIFVGEERGPTSWQNISVDCKPVVLRCHVAAVCTVMHARLVLASVTIPVDKQKGEQTVKIT